jgi:hypothetical protein
VDFLTFYVECRKHKQKFEKKSVLHSYHLVPVTKRQETLGVRKFASRHEDKIFLQIHHVMSVINVEYFGIFVLISITFNPYPANVYKMVGSCQC